jgi:hypothetical protein
MPYVALEMMIPASEWTKTLHALDRSTKMTGTFNYTNILLS